MSGTPVARTFTPITRDTIQALSGGTGVPPTMSDVDFNTLCQTAEIRLLSALCRDDHPAEDDPLYPVWTTLLANWIRAMWSAIETGIDHVTSIAPRNFRVEFGDDGQIELADFWDDWADVLGLFSECKDGTGIAYQRDYSWWQWAPDGFSPTEVWPDLPPGGPLA